MRQRVDRETPETKLKKEFLKVIRTFPFNKFIIQYPSDCRFCADCPCDNDNYIRRANTRLGIFLCFYCARTHIQLFGEGSEYFAGKAIDKRFHEWTDQEVKMMLSWGNWKANALWGGKMTEEQATEEGRYGIFMFTDDRLVFIRAKYFGRDVGVPELSWYTDVESGFDQYAEGTFLFEENEDEDEGGIEQRFKALSMTEHPKVKKMARKHFPVRRIDVSSSESDEDIGEVLKEVVRDYTATHSRITRPAETSTRRKERRDGSLMH